jgi:hypothetical protein
MSKVAGASRRSQTDATGAETVAGGVGMVGRDTVKHNKTRWSRLIIFSDSSLTIETRYIVETLERYSGWDASLARM